MNEIGRVLLTGSNGFVGRVLVPQLLGTGYRVICATHAPVYSSATENVVLDIRDPQAVNEAVQKVQPTHVIHLAAVTHVPTSFSKPVLTWQTNVMGTINLLESVRAHSPEAFVLFVSSSEVYGESFKAGMPLKEETACQPMNPYAASKMAAEVAVNQYFRQGGNGVIARPFNHIGPGQSPDFVTASFAKQIAAIEAGLQEPVMKVGNLDASRDFLDVRDVCAAYLELLTLTEIPLQERVFNIASGQPHRISGILQTLIQQSSATIQVEQDPKRLRPSDIPVAAGDCNRLRSKTNWSPEYSLADTLASLLDDWRKKVNG